MENIFFSSVDAKNRLIRFQCSYCDYSIVNNRQYFLGHLEHEHAEVSEFNFE